MSKSKLKARVENLEWQVQRQLLMIATLILAIDKELVSKELADALIAYTDEANDETRSAFTVALQVAIGTKAFQQPQRPLV